MATFETHTFVYSFSLEIFTQSIIRNVRGPVCGSLCVFVHPPLTIASKMTAANLKDEDEDGDEDELMMTKIMTMTKTMTMTQATKTAKTATKTSTKTSSKLLYSLKFGYCIFLSISSFVFCMINLMTAKVTE